jgi:leucyl/phenylalanyl-tRNA--protein transferase
MNELPIRWLSGDDPPEAFPDIERAAVEPDGLLAAGGDLSRERLLHAYRHGIFPWYEDGQPILWWSPDPRCVLLPENLHIARRLRRWLRNAPFELSFNTAFTAVVDGCAGSRLGHQLGQTGTWITREMSDAYSALHRDGWAHSVEIWNGPSLVGGLYGLAIGKAFFGESMFSRETNASKTAMLGVCRELIANEFLLFDCQVVSPHLLSLGATAIARNKYRRLLDRACQEIVPFRGWPQNRIPASALSGG